MKRESCTRVFRPLNRGGSLCVDLCFDPIHYPYSVVSHCQLAKVITVSGSESKPLEVWVAEDSPFYRLVVEEAIEEISKVTDFPISLTVFERFGDIREALQTAMQTGTGLPTAVLSDLHFPDNAHDDIQDILNFYGEYACLVPVSFMSCNPDSLVQAERLAKLNRDALLPAQFLRKDTSDTMSHLVKTIHAMVFAPRNCTNNNATSLA